MIAMKISFFFFSATWPEDVRRIAARYMRNPIQIYVGTLDLAVCLWSNRLIEFTVLFRLYTVFNKILKLLKKKKNLIW